jgi:hypothetical protein
MRVVCAHKPVPGVRVVLSHQLWSGQLWDFAMSEASPDLCITPAATSAAKLCHTLSYNLPRPAQCWIRTQV